jgi:hypothetical protein
MLDGFVFVRDDKLISGIRGCPVYNGLYFHLLGIEHLTRVFVIEQLAKASSRMLGLIIWMAVPTNLYGHEPVKNTFIRYLYQSFL